MSKRLQVVMPDDEYRAVERAARRRGQRISQYVRESLQRSLAEGPEMEPDARAAAILRFARFSGPSADIDEMLADIERGRDLA